MLNKKFYKHYVFLEQINNLIEKNILKFNNISIIIDIDHNNNKNLEKESSIIQFAKKNKIPFFFKNNFQKCIRYKADGIFIDSVNKCIIKPILLKKKFTIIGLAHNQLEYIQKLKQKCIIIMLSPLFYNEKYSINKILGILKFNNKAINWKTRLCALGGINQENLKKITLTKSEGIAFKKFVIFPEIKKPAYNLM
jgi:thiamine-phosphate pyrophosphorylase